MKQKDKYLERVCRDFFAGQMTLRDCREDVREYMKKYPTAKQNLSTRRDDRMYFDAALQIKMCTLKESYTIGIFEEYLKACGYDIKIEELGNDAVGEIFLDYKEHKPDYNLDIKGTKFPFDLKLCPTVIKNTFKKTDLDVYSSESGGCGMLVLMGPYAKMNPPRMKKENENNPEFGKMVQKHLDDFEDYCDKMKKDLKNGVITRYPVITTFAFYGPNSIKELNKFEGRQYSGFAGYKKSVRVTRKGSKDWDYSDSTLDLFEKKKLIDFVKIENFKPKLKGPLGKLFGYYYK